MRLPTEPSPRWMQGRDGLGWATVVMGAVVVVLVVYLVVLIPTGTSILPTKSKGDQRLANLNALRSAAQYQLGAMYTYNYKTMNAMVANVAAGATGTFAEEWQERGPTVAAAAPEFQTVQTSTIPYLSVHQMTGTSATLLAVVDIKLTNTQTQKLAASSGCPAKTYCGAYHLWVTYTKVAGQWKLSDLEYSND